MHQTSFPILTWFFFLLGSLAAGESAPVEIWRVESSTPQMLRRVLSTPQKTVVVLGNAFGIPQAPGGKQFVTLGTDPGGLPGVETIDPDSSEAFLTDHPARTGFVLECDTEGRPTSGLRFAQGLATIDAAVLSADGALITAGQARKGFTNLCSFVQTVPSTPGDPASFGPVSMHGVVMPGDVYVARWTADRRGLAWVVLFQAHRRPPERILLAADGRLIVDVRGIVAISPDGKTLQRCPWKTPNSEREFSVLAAVLPQSPGLILAGWQRFHTGDNNFWVAPVLEHRALDGSLVERWYDWTPALIGNPLINALQHTPLSHACVGTDGRLTLAAVVITPQSLLERCPVDPLIRLPQSGQSQNQVPLDLGREERIHFAQFDPRFPSKGTWHSLTRSKTRILLNGLHGCPGGKTLVFGEFLPLNEKGAFLGKRNGFTCLFGTGLEMDLSVQEIPDLRVTDACLKGDSVLILAQQPGAAGRLLRRSLIQNP